MKKIYFASGNDHKRKEIEALFPSYEIVLPKDEGIEFNPVEDGMSFVENASIKAKALWNIVHAPTLADDSGLSVDALSGRPGIYSARYGEKDGKRLEDSERNKLLLSELRDVQDRSAHFVSALVFIFDENRTYSIEERVDGKIAYVPSGSHGFGYDPIFIIDGIERNMAELSDEEKNIYSHRAKSSALMNIIMKNIWR